MLTDLKVSKDDRGFYLSAEYILDYEHTTQKLIIPKIRIPDRGNYPSFVYNSQDTYLFVAPDRLPLDPDDTGARFTITTIKEKPKEMTLSEIEKKLGYKVKIVSE